MKSSKWPLSYWNKIAFISEWVIKISISTSAVLLWRLGRKLKTQNKPLQHFKSGLRFFAFIFLKDREGKITGELPPLGSQPECLHWSGQSSEGKTQPKWRMREMGAQLPEVSLLHSVRARCQSQVLHSRYTRSDKIKCLILNLEMFITFPIFALSIFKYN